MAELLKLSPEARRNLAQVLYPQPERTEKHIEQESFFEACNDALDLSLRIKRMRAVAECFANDYVDTCNGITCAMAVASRPETYESLFNAFYEIMADVDEEADKLHHNLDGLYKEA